MVARHGRPLSADTQGAVERTLGPAAMERPCPLHSCSVQHLQPALTNELQPGPVLQEDNHVAPGACGREGSCTVVHQRWYINGGAC